MIRGLSGFSVGTTSTRTVEKRGNTVKTRIQLRDHEGNDRGSISITKTEKSGPGKKKRFPYNHKEISAQLMQTKTPGEASRVAARARRRVAQLMRSKKNSEYDEAEIEAALLHAEQMERVAQKRRRNLEVEEQAERGIERTETEEMLEGEEEAQGTEGVSGEESSEGAAAEDETLNGMSEEDLEKAMRELEQALDEMEKIEESAEDFAESMDEMSEALSGDMEPADLEEMKKKHRADEQRDIVRADMKYLKALFDKLAREKAQAKAATALSNLSSSMPTDLRAPAPAASGSSGGGDSGSGASPAASSAPAAPVQGGSIDYLA